MTWDSIAATSSACAASSGLYVMPCSSGRALSTAVSCMVARWSRRVRGVLHAGGKVFRVVLRQADDARSPRHQTGAYTPAARTPGRGGCASQRVCRARAPRRPAAPATGPRPVGAHSSSGSSVPARGEQLRVLAQARRPSAATRRPQHRKTLRRPAPGLPPGLSLRGRPQGGATPASIERVAERDRLPCAWRRRPPASRPRTPACPRVPGHRVERRHAHQRGTERLRGALRRGHGDAHAGERSRSAADAHARQLAALHAGFAQQARRPAASSCVFDARCAATSTAATGSTAHAAAFKRPSPMEITSFAVSNANAYAVSGTVLPLLSNMVPFMAGFAARYHLPRGVRLGRIRHGSGRSHRLSRRNVGFGLRDLDRGDGARAHRGATRHDEAAGACRGLRQARLRIVCPHGEQLTGAVSQRMRGTRGGRRPPPPGCGSPGSRTATRRGTSRPTR